MDLQKVRYTLDFGHNVSLPHSARQVCPIYFETPLKVQIFRVNTEAVPKEVNYLIREGNTIGPYGKNSPGPNTVVSLSHHFFDHHDQGEKECVLHAD